MAALQRLSIGVCQNGQDGRPSKSSPVVITGAPFQCCHRSSASERPEKVQAKRQSRSPWNPIGQNSLLLATMDDWMALTLSSKLLSAACMPKNPSNNQFQQPPNSPTPSTCPDALYLIRWHGPRALQGRSMLRTLGQVPRGPSQGTQPAITSNSHAMAQDATAKLCSRYLLLLRSQTGFDGIYGGERQIAEGRGESGEGAEAASSRTRVTNSRMTVE